MKLAPGKYRTRDGSDAEVFAEHEGLWYGRVGKWPASWEGDGERVAGLLGPNPNWDILPPEPAREASGSHVTFTMSEGDNAPPSTVDIKVICYTGEEYSAHYKLDRIDIPATTKPEPVKKWRWVMENENTGTLIKSIGYHDSAGAAQLDYGNWTAIARIEGSEIEG